MSVITSRSATTPVAGSASTVSVPVPSNLLPGDIVVAFVTAFRPNPGTPGNPAFPTGFASPVVETTSWGAGYDQKCAWSWMRAGATPAAGCEPGIGVYTFTAANATQMTAHIVLLRSRLGTGSPVGANSNTAYIVSDTTCRAASVTPGANEDLVWMGWSYHVDGLTMTLPTGLTAAQYRRLLGNASRTATKANVANEATGDMDSTLGDTEVCKHAFCIGFQKQPAPAITTLAPAEVAEYTSPTVVITGTALFGATAVSVGGHAATSFTVDSDTQITAVFPSHVAATDLDVVVTTPMGASAAEHFTFFPDLISIERADGSGGTFVEVYSGPWATGNPWLDIAAGLTIDTAYYYRGRRITDSVPTAYSAIVYMVYRETPTTDPEFRLFAPSGAFAGIVPASVTWTERSDASDDLNATIPRWVYGDDGTRHDRATLINTGWTCEWRGQRYFVESLSSDQETTITLKARSAEAHELGHAYSNYSPAPFVQKSKTPSAIMDALLHGSAPSVFDPTCINGDFANVAGAHEDIPPVPVGWSAWKYTASRPDGVHYLADGTPWAWDTWQQWGWGPTPTDNHLGFRCWPSYSAYADDNLTEWEEAHLFSPILEVQSDVDQQVQLDLMLNPGLLVEPDSYISVLVEWMAPDGVTVRATDTYDITSEVETDWVTISVPSGGGYLVPKFGKMRVHIVFHAAADELVPGVSSQGVDTSLPHMFASYTAGWLLVRAVGVVTYGETIGTGWTYEGYMDTRDPDVLFTDPAWTRWGSWTVTGTDLRSTGVGDSLGLVFTGDSVTVHFGAAGGGATADMYVDGILKAAAVDVSAAGTQAITGLGIVNEHVLEAVVKTVGLRLTKIVLTTENLISVNWPDKTVLECLDELVKLVGGILVFDSVDHVVQHWPEDTWGIDLTAQNILWLRQGLNITSFTLEEERTEIANHLSFLGYGEGAGRLRINVEAVSTHDGVTSQTAYGEQHTNYVDPDIKDKVPARLLAQALVEYLAWPKCAYRIQVADEAAALCKPGDTVQVDYGSVSEKLRILEIGRNSDGGPASLVVGARARSITDILAGGNRDIAKLLRSLA